MLRLIAPVLMPVLCLPLMSGSAHTENCSNLRPSANCSGTQNAHKLKQIRPGRSANARSASKILRRLIAKEVEAKKRQALSSPNEALDGAILIRPADKQIAEALAQLGIPTIPGVPPIIIVLPEDNEKDETETAQ